MSARSYEGQHTFASQFNTEYKYENTEEWLTSGLNVPTWETKIPHIIGLSKEPLDGPWVEAVIDFLDTDIGRIVWHMFCVETYNYPLRHDISVGDITKTKIVEAVNGSGNSVLSNPRIREIADDAKKRNRSAVLLPGGIDASFARLFHYYECYKKDRPYMFKIRNRILGRVKADCPVCGTGFSSKGDVDFGDGPQCFVDPKQEPVVPVDDFDFFRYEADWKIHGGISYERRDNRI